MWRRTLRPETAFRPESAEQITQFLEPKKSYPIIGDNERRLAPADGPSVDLSMFSPWQSFSYYGLTRRLMGDCRMLFKGDVQGVSTLVDRQRKPRFTAVIIDGVIEDDESGELISKGVFYAPYSHSSVDADTLASSAIFAYLTQEDFAVNPYQDEIHETVEEFYRKDPASLDDLPQRLAVAFDRRKLWGV